MGGKPGGGGQTIGYRYLMSLHMGLCRGPIDELVQINVGDLEAWPNPEASNSDAEVGFEAPTYAALAGLGAFSPPGTVARVTSDPDPSLNGLYGKLGDGNWMSIPDSSVGGIGATDSGVVSISAPELFGGEKKEGGVEGSLELLMGESTQVPPDTMKTLMGGRVPGFRGVVTAFFDGMLTAMNPYPKTWKFRMRRATKGWWQDQAWYPAKAAIWLADSTICGMNPAHILYECATNPEWGRGLDPSLIDENSFVLAANTLCNEMFGLCILWTRQEPLSDFVSSVINHIGAALYVSRETGLLTLRLIRDDYDPADVPLYDETSGLISVVRDDTAAPDTAVNEIIVRYRDPVSGKDRSARWQNPASQQALGAIISTTTQYPGIPTYDLAMRVAERDGMIQSGVMKRFKVTLDRRAWRIAPASVFAIADARRGIGNMILRVGEVIEETDESFTVTAVQDVFGLPSTAYAEEQPTQWVNPIGGAASEPSAQQAEEITWRELVQRLPPGELAQVTDSQGFVGGLAARPATGNSLNYSFRTRLGSDAYVERDVGDFAPTAVLSASIGPLDIDIAFEDLVGWGLAQIGPALQIGDEICNIVSIDPTAGTAVVERGCVDTIPQAHTAGARLWARDLYLATDTTEYADTEVVSAKFLTRTSTAVQGEASATAETVTVTLRQARPYPPANVQVEGVSVIAEPEQLAAGEFEVTWSHRDRILQSDQLVDYLAASVGPEAGVSYVLRFYDDSDGTLLRTETTSDDNFTYDSAMDSADGSPARLRLELTSERDGLESRAVHVVTITRSLTFDSTLTTFDSTDITMDAT